MSSLVTKVLVLLFSKLATGLIDCPMMYRSVGTVCGTDGVTYPSLCELEVARVFDPALDLGYFGMCTTYCKDIWDPVCGNDMITYSNLCVFEIEARKLTSLEVLHSGKCWSGEDRVMTQDSHSDDKDVTETASPRIEVGAELEADEPRINLIKQDSKQITAIAKQKPQGYEYADTGEEKFQKLRLYHMFRF